MRVTDSLGATAMVITLLTVLPRVSVGQTQLPAFPGAEGFGAFAVGGRVGQVMLVTTLNDYVPRREAPIPGSLRAACEAKGPRIVVFRVAGTITLKTTLNIDEPFLTLAGQSAPGGGICLKDFGVQIRAPEVVIRYLRFRPGDRSGKELDALSVSAWNKPDAGPVRNIIIDHCSASWGTDEVLSVSGAEITDVTVQWCIISESLNKSVHKKGAHGYGSLLRCNGNVTFHHNLYAHHASRSPRPGTYGEGSILLDFRNNVIYDTMGYSAADPVKMNYVGNFIKRPRGGKCAFKVGGKATKIHADRNTIADADGKIRPDWEIIAKAEPHHLVREPFPVATVRTDDAETAYERVLESGGAILPTRDPVDARVVRQVIENAGQLIDSQTQVAGWPELGSSTAPSDRDRDGMPDAWETEHHLDPRNPNDSGTDRDGDGYSNIEEWLNGTDP